MRFSSLLLSLPLLAAAQVTLPSDAVEGLAIHLEDESGNITYVHENQFEDYGIKLALDETTGNTTDISSLRRRGLPKGDKITCENWKSFGIMDFRTNLVDFIDYIGCGYTIITNPGSSYKYVALSSYRGSNVIYICNYSGQYRTFKGAQLLDFAEQVFNYCGQRASAGWYTDSYDNTAWGYTNSYQGFCGPKQ